MRVLSISIIISTALPKKRPTVFTYRFNNVQKDVEFFLFSSGVESEDYNAQPT